MWLPGVVTRVTLAVLCVCLSVPIVLCQDEETCTTVEGGIGKCAPLVVCAPYFTLLRQSQTIPLTVQFRDAQCGYEDNNPKVCCPLSAQAALTPEQDGDLKKASLASPTLGPSEDSLSKDDGGVDDKLEETCTTVEGGIGKCAPLVVCAPYFTLLRQSQMIPLTVQFRDAQCGNKDNNQKVCCPLPSSSTSPPRDAASAKSLSPSDFITAFPEPPVCGLSTGHINKVVGGVNAKLGAFPWMALLGIRRGNEASPYWMCGGSLISHRHVLTAAHCIKNELNVVRLGELDFERDDEGATPIDVPIKRKIKHEHYNDPYFTNDIGLLILERDVQFTKLISPICMPVRQDLRDNTFVDYNPFVAGWGNTDNRGASNSHLQVLQLPVLENSYCEKAYESRVIDERVMCVGYVTGGKDSCTGDSGGPLMQADYDATSRGFYYYQTGIVSYGHVTCGSPDSPGVYTRVGSFVPWLQKHVLGLEE